MYKKMKPFLLVFMIAALGNFIPANASAQEKTSFTEMAKLQGLQAEQDALGEKWMENQEKLGQLGIKYETLDRELREGTGRLGMLRAEAETVEKEYERKMPEIKRRTANIEVKDMELERDVAAHNAQCDRTVSEEDYARLSGPCNASIARLNAVEAELNEEASALDREVFAIEESYNRTIEAHNKLFEELQQKEAQQQELLRQGAALEASSKEILEAGRLLGIQIKELEGSICKPGNFGTAEAFEECMRTIFDGGDGTKPPLEKRTPVDMSPTGEKETSPYDLDPNVVKPDWGEEDPDG